MVIKKSFPAKSLKKMGFLAAAVLVTASPAYAGFDWTPPAKRKTTEVPVVAAPAPVVDMEPIAAPLPEVDAFPTGGVLPSQIPQTESLPDTQGQPSDHYDTVDGFGSDIPLVLMLNQVVPSGYSYSFDPGVNPGGLVSWNGGHPWNEILDASLATKGMYAVVSGRNVRVLMGEKPAAELEEVEVSAPPVPASAPVSVPQPSASVEAPPEIVPDSFVPPVSAELQGDEMIPQSYPRRVRPDGVVEPLREPVQDIERPFFPDEAAYGDKASAPVPLTPPPVSPVVQGMSYDASSTAAPAPVMEVAAPVFKKEAMPVMDPFEINFWHAEQGQSLKAVLEEWSSMAGVAILWNAQSDYLLPAPVRMHGTFPDAVTSVLTTFSTVSPRPLGKLHPNLPEGPSVLVIQSNDS